jgi:hypothetical protein
LGIGWLHGLENIPRFQHGAGSARQAFAYLSTLLHPSTAGLKIGWPTTVTGPPIVVGQLYLVKEINMQPRTNVRHEIWFHLDFLFEVLLSVPFWYAVYSIGVFQLLPLALVIGLAVFLVLLGHLWIHRCSSTDKKRIVPR